MKRSQFRAGLKAAVEQHASNKRAKPNEPELRTKRLKARQAIQDKTTDNHSDSDVSSFTTSERRFLFDSPKNIRSKCQQWLQSSENNKTQGVDVEKVEADESSKRDRQVQSPNTLNIVSSPIVEDVDLNSNVLTNISNKNVNFKRRLFQDIKTVNSKDQEKETPALCSIKESTSAVLELVHSDSTKNIATHLSEDIHVNELSSKEQEAPSTNSHKKSTSDVLKKVNLETFDTNTTLSRSLLKDNHVNESSTKDQEAPPTSSIKSTSTVLEMVTLEISPSKENDVNQSSSTGSNIYDLNIPTFELTEMGLVPVEIEGAIDMESLLQEQAVDDITDDSGETVAEIIEPEVPINIAAVMDFQTPGTARGRVKDRNVQLAAPLKKVRNPALWKVNDAKVKRHLGLAYTSKEGKQFAAKTMRASCGKSCKYKCDTRVTEEDRNYFKDRYYSKNENQTKKWLFILSFVESKAVKSSQEGDVEDDAVDNAEEPRTPLKKKRSRSCHNEFFMELKSGKKVKVCKDMFKSTLVVSDSTISTALKKRGSPEKRGKVGVKRVIPEAVIKSIHNHIQKFPRVESHYCRKDTTYEYLEEMVGSVSNMHRLYLEWMDSHHTGQQKATLRQYTDQFNMLKIKFFQPRKDLCAHCVSYENIPEEQRTPEVVQCHQDHILHKDLAKSIYSQDREAFLKDPTVVVSSYDMEKTHLVPQCKAGDVYYSRKLSVNNFTIKEVGTAQGYCYVWDESIAHRGANEVTSFVHSYLEQRSQEGVKTFYFWSDNCGAQNKNRYLYGMYMAAAAKFDIKIVHKYLMTGHTSNDADGMHSLIERKTSKMDLYVPEDWYTAIENVKKTGKKYIVKRAKTEDIKEYHDFVDKKTIWYKDVTGSIVRWSEIVDISVSSEEPWKLYFKYHHADDYTAVVIRKSTAGRPVNLKTMQHICAYSNPPTIEALKKNDLLKLCQNLIVPMRAHNFYETLASS